MITNVRARYANGVLTLLEPLDLEDGAEVSVSVEAAQPKASHETSTPKQDDFAQAVQEYTHALSIRPNKAAFANRAFALLCLSQWDSARSDLLSARNMGMNLVSAFRADYADVAAFEKAHDVKLPQDIADMVSIEEEPQPAFTGESILEMFDRLRKSVPPEAWDGYPADSAKNYKHYLYGHRKKED